MMSGITLLERQFPAITASAQRLAVDLAARVAGHRIAGKPYILGISGAQGSGKSTLADMVGAVLKDCHGLTVATLSLDDFYLPKTDRQNLAATIHPLCGTRGVAGTHDSGLMLRILDQLATAAADTVTAIPRFDKLTDDRKSEAAWTRITGRPDCIILEGWCVGLRADHLPALAGPINALEAGEDADGRWASWSASHLPAYAAIWDRIDWLFGIMLPDLETVVQSRLKQEQSLVAAGGDPAKAMDEAGIRRFVAHYERHTRALWSHFAQVADQLVLRNAAFGYQPA